MWIYAALTVCGIVIAAVLFAPVTIDVSIAKDADSAAARVGARFRWLVFSLRSDRGPKRARPRRPPKRGRPSRRSRYGWASVQAVLRSPGFVRRCSRLLGDLLRLARPDRTSVRARVGFDDPAETGLFQGWLFASQGLTATTTNVLIDIEPNFSGETIEGRADLRWSRSLATLLWPIVTFLLSPAVWRAAIRARRSARPAASA